MRFFAGTICFLLLATSCVTRRESEPVAVKPLPTAVEEMSADALALLARNHRWSAAALYRAVLAEDPRNSLAANNLAYVLISLGGDLGEAERLAMRAITLDPSNPRYLDTMGAVLAAAGRGREAVPFLEKAHARAASLPLDEQRKIVSRLVSVYQETEQGHLARQVMEAYRVKDQGFNFDD
jgi:Flp pilus assembly protein TadD